MGTNEFYKQVLILLNKLVDKEPSVSKQEVAQMKEEIETLKQEIAALKGGAG